MNDLFLKPDFLSFGARYHGNHEGRQDFPPGGEISVPVFWTLNFFHDYGVLSSHRYLSELVHVPTFIFPGSTARSDHFHENGIDRLSASTTKIGV